MRGRVLVFSTLNDANHYCSQFGKRDIVMYDLGVID